MNNAFLLGLWWEYAQRSQELRDKDANLKQLRDVARAGLVPNLMGTIGALEAEKVRLEATIKIEAEQLANFRVHEQYQHIERRASDLTAAIHQLANDNVSDRRTIEFYESSFQSERPSNPDLVVRMYSEAKVVLPDNVIKRLDEVHTFHQQVVANREGFLRDEIDRLNRHVSDREQEIRRLDADRASLLTILQTYGALEEYTLLQQRHAQAVAQLQEIQARIDNLTKYEQEKLELRIEQERLQLAARSDYEERRPIRERAVMLFNANSQALYEAPGKLIIDIAPTGYKFQVEIERSLSQGIEQMKVFCYDLMLAQLWSPNPVSPGFLLHDSTIFDGVDERQIAHAIETAAASCERDGFQYICCLNSDLIPWEDFDSLDLNDYIRLELTDATESGSLLGIRF